MSTTAERVAAVQQAHADARLIASTPTTALLRLAYALTHRIHDAGNTGAQDDELRAQRDLIDAEVLRRTGGR